jgi:hypothetical protein
MTKNNNNYHTNKLLSGFKSYKAFLIFNNFYYFICVTGLFDGSIGIPGVVSTNLTHREKYDEKIT